MQRVVLVTNHYFGSDHKAGFHWLAESCWRAGHDVLFLTESLSWLSWLRRNERFGYRVLREANRVVRFRDRLTSYVWLTPFHPTNLRHVTLNRMSAVLWRHYGDLPMPGLSAANVQADHFIFDSDHGLFLFDRFRRANPRARFVYRVSDDIRMLGHHPIVAQQEDRVVPRFDRVSVPSAPFLKRFGALPQTRLHAHGLQKDLFDRPNGTPFKGPGPHVLFVGKNFVDCEALCRAVRLFPRWTFHVIGAVPRLPDAVNLIRYGERPFVELVPYLQHADIGLQILVDRPGAECFADSLKMQQYSYCRLPIVAPRFLQSKRAHVYHYDVDSDDSIRQALLDALRHDRSQIDRSGILSWDELAGQLLE